MSDRHEPTGRRLREGDGPRSELVREFLDATASVIDREDAAWRRLQPRLQGGPPPRRTLWWLLAPTTLAVVLVAGVRLFGAGDEAPAIAPKTPVPVSSFGREAPGRVTSVPAPSVGGQAPAHEDRRLAPLAAGPTRKPLQAGATALVRDEAGEIAVAIALSRSGHARIDRGPRALAVRLARGSVSLDVSPRSPGEQVLVISGAYRFVVVGTVFRVSRAAGEVQLDVREGSVEVWRGSTRLARVQGGESWAAEPVPRPQPAPTAAPATKVPTPGTPLACGELTRAGRVDEALACFGPQAQGAHLGAETALLEIARLQQRARGDLEGALATLRAYQERFPDGVFRSEVDLTVVELLPQLGRHKEALAESGRLMASPGGQHRLSELALLRGNLYREVLGDCAAAESEYSAGARGPGRAAQEAAFFQAVCLQMMGRHDRAREAFRAYLARPGVTRRLEAAARLESLGLK